MRHVLTRNRGIIAIPAATALLLMGCEADDEPDPGTEQAEDEEVMVPAGVFGERCQELLVAADVDDDASGVDGETDLDVDADADADAGTDADADVESDLGEDEADDELGIAPASLEGDEDEADDEDETDLDVEDETDDEAADTDTADPEPTPEAPGEADLRELGVIEALEALPEFDRLVDELEASQLQADLDGDGEITVFAPLDEAFDQVEDASDADTATEEDGDEDLTGDTGESVTVDDRLLAYHLHTEGALGAQQLVDQESVTTEADDAGDLRVTADGEVLTVDADESVAQVVCANIETDDGTIHVIDELLVPRATESDSEDDADPDAQTDTDADGDTDAEAGDDAGTDPDEADADGAGDTEDERETDEG